VSVYVGTDNLMYEQIHEWGILPGELVFGKISAVAIDSKDRVYMYQRDRAKNGTPPIVVFDGAGQYLQSWGEEIFIDPHGIFISSSDELYAVDRDGHQVVKCALTGEVLLRLGHGGKPALQAPFNHPNDVAVSESGEIYVADGYANSCVHRFTPNGEHVLSWGRPGTGPGEFRVPHGIWVDTKERVFVADRENHRVQLFTTDGAFLTEWTDFYRPTDIFIDAHGAIYVTDLIPRVSVFDPDGTLLARIRPANNNVHGVWADSLGNLYVAATDGPTLEKYVRQT
jgi:DNA-binding beta-propeller fold protein YncE